MDKEQITEGNKLIAEFMELAQIQVYNLDERKHYPAWQDDRVNLSGASWCIKGNEHQLTFHKDWNSLKQVVDEIYTYSLAHKEAKKIRDMSIVVEIGACWEKCVEFIKWYNKNK